MLFDFIAAHAGHVTAKGGQTSKSTRLPRTRHPSSMTRRSCPGTRSKSLVGSKLAHEFLGESVLAWQAARLFRRGRGLAGRRPSSVRRGRGVGRRGGHGRLHRNDEAAPFSSSLSATPTQALGVRRRGNSARRNRQSPPRPEALLRSKSLKDAPGGAFRRALDHPSSPSPSERAPQDEGGRGAANRREPGLGVTSLHFRPIVLNWRTCSVSAVSTARRSIEGGAVEPSDLVDFMT